MNKPTEDYTSLIGGSRSRVARIVPLMIAASYSLAAGAVDQTSPLATNEQQEVEKQAIAVFAAPVVKAQIAKSKAEFLKSPVATDPEARQTVERAVNELAFAAVLDAVDGDAQRPKVVWAFTAPRTWLGHAVPGSRWGIDNPDNVYRFAPVDGASRYELTVRPPTQGPAQYSFLIYDSFVGEDGKQDHLDTPIAGLRDKDIQKNADGSFTLTIDDSPAAGRANHLTSTAAARVLLIRNTFSDWNHQTPQSVSIRRLGPDPDKIWSESKIEERAVTLIKAATTTVLGWETSGFAAQAKPNSITKPFERGGGWGYAANGNYKLGADEALVVTLDHHGARYVGFDLTDQWLVSRDHISATGSLNNSQAQANPDGSVTYVIARTDPGVANWLDTGGLASGKLLIRWQLLPDGIKVDGAVRSAEVVKFGELRQKLPHDFPSVTAEARREDLKVRAASYANRYSPSVSADSRLAADR